MEMKTGPREKMLDYKSNAESGDVTFVEENCIEKKCTRKLCNCIPKILSEYNYEYANGINSYEFK